MTIAEASETHPYNETWFQNRAFAALRRLGDGTWDFSDSLLLYAPGGDDEYETSQQPDKSYARLVTQPERQYLQAIAPKVAAELPDNFEYVDLGPGTEHKEQFLFDALREQGKRFVYKPVDISPRYLEMAAEHGRAQGIPVEPVMSPFEELTQKLVPGVTRFVSLGLTYGNYPPATVLPMLRAIAGPEGYSFVEAQIRERTDMAALTEAYQRDIATMSAVKLQLLGLRPDSDVIAYSCDDTIRMWATLGRSTSELEARGIQPGHKIMTFMSLRPSCEDFQKDVADAIANPVMFDTGGSFVAALL